MYFNGVIFVRSNMAEHIHNEERSSQPFER